VIYRVIANIQNIFLYGEENLKQTMILYSIILRKFIV